MLKFVAMSLIMSATAGVLLGIGFTWSFYFQNKKERIKAIMVVALVTGFFITGVYTFITKCDKILWNNGYCDCRSKWTYLDVEKSRNNIESYYYYCNNCGESIKLHTFFGK